MSSMNDFRSWLDTKDPKIVRSLVLDAYSSDRQFLRIFEKVVDSGLSSRTGKAWYNLFSAEHDWDFTKNASDLLDSSLWDEATKISLTDILMVIAKYLDIKWKSGLDHESSQIESDQFTAEPQSLTQKYYERQRLEMEMNRAEKFVYGQRTGTPKTRHDTHIDGSSSRSPNSNDVRDRRGQLVSRSSLNNSPQAPQTQHPWVPKVDNYIYSSSKDQQKGTSSTFADKEVRDRRGQLVPRSSLSKPNHPSLPANPWPVLAPFLLAMTLGLMAGLDYLYSDYVDDLHSDYVQDDLSTEESAYETAATNADIEYSLALARRLQQKAVLICEHNRVISLLEGIQARTSNFSRQESQADLLISKSKGKIDFLDQTGEYKYSEDGNCTHGHQWFDEMTDNNARMFIAISQKCKNPKAVFDFRREDDLSAPVIDQYQMKLNHMSGRSGEIQIPWMAEGYQVVFLGDFKCN